MPFKKIFKATILLVVILVSVMIPVTTARAQTVNDAIFNKNCEGSASDFCKSVNEEAAKGDRILGPNGIFTRIAQAIVYLTAAFSVVAVVIGGLRYTISGGDSAAIKGAKDMILYALVGLVVAMFAQVIVSFVLSKI